MQCLPSDASGEQSTRGTYPHCRCESRPGACLLSAVPLPELSGIPFAAVDTGQNPAPRGAGKLTDPGSGHRRSGAIPNSHPHDVGHRRTLAGSRPAPERAFAGPCNRRSDSRVRRDVQSLAGCRDGTVETQAVSAAAGGDPGRDPPADRRPREGGHQCRDGYRKDHDGNRRGRGDACRGLPQDAGHLPSPSGLQVAARDPGDRGGRPRLGFERPGHVAQASGAACPPLVHPAVGRTGVLHPGPCAHAHGFSLATCLRPSQGPRAGTHGARQRGLAGRGAYISLRGLSALRDDTQGR